ncbi:MAG: DUF3078 domain-containing protein [Bacteroidales bacterium]|nr:DUF3078 domain-containing protein [Bacteroidales bacterium]MBQ4026676.1 DUF3078 domain-containing protein [Bacteroidales bacterium]
MKKLTFLAGLLVLSVWAYAQDDAQQAAAEAAAELVGAPKEEAPVAKPKYWKSSSVFDLGLNQTSLTNWAAGGFNNVTLSAGVDAKADYAKELLSWNNRLQLQYGFIWSQDKKNVLQKSNDRIYLESKLAYKTGKDSKWNYTASYDFRSQFTDTWGKYVEKESEPGIWEAINLKSGFIAPAYNNIALGMEWKPNEWFDVNISPLTGSLTICTIPELRKGYGMPLGCAEDDAAYVAALDTKDPAQFGKFYRNMLFQLGASVKANAKFALNDVFTYETQVVLFTDYLNKPFLQNRINWDNKITWQIAKFFKVGFNTWLIYDPIVEIDGVVSKLQFKDFLAFNFTYTLGAKK